MKRCEMIGRRTIVLFAILTGLMVAFIWGNSCLSREESGAQSGFVTRLLRPLLDPNGIVAEEAFHHFIRKMAHFTEFALLGVFVGGLFRSIGVEKRAVFFSLPVLSVLLVAVLDEYIQYFAGRGSAVTDVMLDFFGGLAGLGIAVAWTLVLRKASK